MNHLAHALLSGGDDDVRLGGLMGDFVRGAIDVRLPEGVRRGIALHRAIDSWTDAHAAIVSARGLFEPPFRRYAGILVDIWFDHLLARDFTRWSAVPLREFSDSTAALLERERARLPESMHAFVRYMRANGLLAAYADRAVIARVFAGVGSRLKRANPVAEGLNEIERLEPELEELFAAFYPQLTAQAARIREAGR